MNLEIYWQSGYKTIIEEIENHKEVLDSFREGKLLLETHLIRDVDGEDIAIINFTLCNQVRLIK